MVMRCCQRQLLLKSGTAVVSSITVFASVVQERRVALALVSASTCSPSAHTVS